MPQSFEPPKFQPRNLQPPTREELQRQIDHILQEYKQEQERFTPNNRGGSTPTDKEASEYRRKYPGIATAARVNLDEESSTPGHISPSDFSSPTWAPGYHVSVTDMSHHHGHTLTRPQIVEMLLAAKRENGMLFKDIAEQMGRSEVWMASALLGQQTFSEAEAERLLQFLRIDHKIAKHAKLVLMEPPMRGYLHGIPVDPTIYRFYEIVQVYGTTFKALIHEKAGDAIMSAVDLEISLDKKKDQNGEEYAMLTLCGKAEPFNKW